MSWAVRLTRSRHGMAGLFAASFLETTILPVPIEVVLVPMMATNRVRAWLLATIALAGCLAGAAVGYGVGLFLFETVGQWLLQVMDWQAAFENFQATFEANGFWAIIAVGVTPVPFQVAMLAAGLTEYPFTLFMLAASLARGVRYFGLALLVNLFGQTVVAWVRRRRNDVPQPPDD